MDSEENKFFSVRIRTGFQNAVLLFRVDKADRLLQALTVTGGPTVKKCPPVLSKHWRATQSSGCPPVLCVWRLFELANVVRYHFYIS